MDSDEYWLTYIWDRSAAIAEASAIVRQKLIEQERLTLEACVVEARAIESSDIQILDLPTGVGRVSRLLAERLGDDAVFVLGDINASALTKAARSMPAQRLLEARCINAYNAASVWRGKFDIIVCLDFFHHVSDLERMLDALCGACKPEGLLIGNVFLREEYRHFDRAKYGLGGSLRRRMMFRVGRGLVRIPSRWISATVRRWGWVRMAPVDRKQFRASLLKFFEIEREIVGSYYWFAARPRVATVTTDIGNSEL